jgi:hypothetical protein
MYSYPWLCNLSINPLLVLRFVLMFNLTEQWLEVSSCGWSEASALLYVQLGKCLEALCQGPACSVLRQCWGFLCCSSPHSHHFPPWRKGIGVAWWPCTSQTLTCRTCMTVVVCPQLHQPRPSQLSGTPALMRDSFSMQVASSPLGLGLPPTGPW